MGQIRRRRQSLRTVKQSGLQRRDLPRTSTQVLHHLPTPKTPGQRQRPRLLLPPSTRRASRTEQSNPSRMASLLRQRQIPVSSPNSPILCRAELSTSILQLSISRVVWTLQILAMAIWMCSRTSTSTPSCTELRACAVAPDRKNSSFSYLLVILLQCL